MAEQKSRRTAPTVQDVINGQSGKPHPRFKSGYTGPKKPPQTATVVQASPVIPAAAHRSGGILDYAWIAYCLVLAIGLTTALVAYGKGGSAGEGIYYPTNVFTITGVVKDIYSDYYNGGLGTAYAAAPAKNTADAVGTETSDDPNNTLLGETVESTVPNSTTGATMTLDVGSSYGSYSNAASHEELLEQLDKAMAANDFEFVGMKLAYEDDETKTLIGYPQSVVEHFTKYMADNPDKRANFLAEVKDGSTFSVKNGSAYLLKLPLLQFTINMGYDGTTISISGFSDQTMDSGQSAVVSPLLPCMYTIHAETAKGSQTSEVECNMNEGNLKINIGVTD
ncbi:MAG: hypothetical protein K6G58_03035 [Lachnospiraceae bacterium]|nr:hypothetical protein [Lachnospiraceae bacterium]